VLACAGFRVRERTPEPAREVVDISLGVRVCRYEPGLTGLHPVEAPGYQPALFTISFILSQVYGTISG
jgi:hypothetical protein